MTAVKRYLKAASAAEALAARRAEPSAAYLAGEPTSWPETGGTSPSR